jgi:hypothetical protein
MNNVNNAVEVLAPLLGIDADSNEGDQLRQLLGDQESTTMAQLSGPNQPAVPATSAAASMIAERAAGMKLKTKQVAAHFTNCGWTAQAGEHGISYLPPLGATNEEIAEAKRGAAAMMDR